MKNVTITSLSRPILVVELSEGLSQMRKNTLSILNHDGWVLLGKPDEIKDVDVRELVETGDADPVGDRFVLGYRSYFDGYENDVPQFTCETATESLLSALESEIYWDVNPYPYPSPYDPRSKTGRFEHGEELEKAEKNYNEAQEKTFNKQRTFIFVKN